MFVGDVSYRWLDFLYAVNSDRLAPTGSTCLSPTCGLPPLAPYRGGDAALRLDSSYAVLPSRLPSRLRYYGIEHRKEPFRGCTQGGLASSLHLHLPAKTVVPARAFLSRCDHLLTFLANILTAFEREAEPTRRSFSIRHSDADLMKPSGQQLRRLGVAVLVGGAERKWYVSSAGADGS